MHGRDQARQARIGRGIVDETADTSLEQGRSEAHPIIGNMHLRRHGDEQRRSSEPGHRLSVGCREVGICSGAGLLAGTISEEGIERVGDVGRLHRSRVRRIDRIEHGGAHGLGMQRDQCHGDGRAVGFAVDVPALGSQRPPHPLKIGDGDAGAEVPHIKAMRGRLGAARGIDGPTLGTASSLGSVATARAASRSAPSRSGRLRLRSAGSPLIDEDEIAAWGVGGQT
jgi:hypothetical protein